MDAISPMSKWNREQEGEITMNLPLLAAIGNGGALFERLNRAETLENIFREVCYTSDASGRESIAAPKSQSEWIAQRDKLQAEIREGMSVEQAATIFPRLAVALLALRDLKGSLKWFGEYQEAIAVIGQGFLLWNLARVLRPIGYAIDHIEQYPPVETTVEDLKWFFKTTIEFLRERDYMKLRHHELYYQQGGREGEEEKLLSLVYLSLDLILDGDVSGPHGALVLATEFDQNTNTAFYMEEWVEKRASALQKNIAYSEEDRLRQRGYYCKVVGVPFEANLVQVSERFQKLAMDYHPDRLMSLPPQQRKHAEEMFKLIQEAYAFLSDPQNFYRGEPAPDFQPSPPIINRVRDSKNETLSLSTPGLSGYLVQLGINPSAV